MKLVAACAFGLETLVKRQLTSLGYEPAVQRPGRIAFSGDWQAVARANLWLRTADRVLIELMQFPAPDFDALFETVKSFDWSSRLTDSANFPVTGRSRDSQLTSVPAIQRCVKKAIVESLTQNHQVNTLPESGPLYRIDVALLKDQAEITLDTTGSSLHRRGYRRLTGQAPLKETLAAALVELSVWNPDRMLVDPFCGIGTIPIEAALLGLGMAPGRNRDFTFTEWPDVGDHVVQEARSEANDHIRQNLSLQITGTDRDSQAIEMARYHARQAGVESQIHFQVKSFDEFRSKRQYGCMITNPPYGERLEETRRLRPLYESIPKIFQRVPTWSLFILTNMPRFESIVQKSATRRRKLFNGRIECTYYQYLGPRPPRDLKQKRTDSSDASDKLRQPEGEEPVFGGLRDKDHEQAQLFHNRLTKRARHLRRWPTRRNIDCFRLYERDIPEIPLIVDRYGDALHITRYERPHDRDLARDAAWLELMKKTAAATLDIPVRRVHLKERKRDGQQYEKIESRGTLEEVTEGDLKFLVNLTDYVDTGLFLDHRNLRQMVREKSSGKEVLNLFAYTGAFTVYAAAGGARSTTTVDLSKNYLDWARKNLELNQLHGPQHEMIAADAMEYLNGAIASGKRFDLAVVDPPTYSNSKKTEKDWDVQQQHSELLNQLRRIMRPGGGIYFSTNFRRFKLNEDALIGMSVREISQQTVPEDFRNQRVHRAWYLQVDEEVSR